MGFMTFVKNLLVRSEGLASENTLTVAKPKASVRRKVTPDKERYVHEDRRKTRKRNAKGQFVRDIRRNFQA
jgi:hypothetical protein